MDYWEGGMDWPIDNDWVCETCREQHGLTWGFVHARCRCNRCHTQYTMREDGGDRPLVTIPICKIVDGYKEPIKQAWASLGIPVDELTEEQFKPFLKPQ